MSEEQMSFASHPRSNRRPTPRRIYPAESDSAALRVDISPTGISTQPDVAIVAIDDPKSADDRERGTDRHVTFASRSTRPTAARRAG
jgi:hypothetical protein